MDKAQIRSRMETYILESISKVNQKGKVNTHGRMVVYLLEILKMVLNMVEANGEDIQKKKNTLKSVISMMEAM